MNTKQVTFHLMHQKMSVDIRFNMHADRIRDFSLQLQHSIIIMVRDAQ